MTATVATISTEAGIAIGTGGDAFDPPTGITAGDLLVNICAKRNALGMSTTAAYHEVDDITGISNTSQLAVYARLATATAADNFELSGGGSGNDDFAVTLMRITNHGITDVTDIIYAFNVQSATANPDPPSLDALVSDDNLWITALCYPPSGAGHSITSGPASYTNVANLESADNSGGIFLSVDRRALTTQVENPGTYTITESRQTVSLTLVIPPLQAPDPKTVTPTANPVGITDSVTVLAGSQAVVDPIGVPDNVTIAAALVHDNPADIVGLVDFVDTTLNTFVNYPDIVDSFGAFSAGQNWPDTLPTPTGVGRLALWIIAVDNPLSIGITGSAGWVKRAGAVAGAQIVEGAVFARLLTGGAQDTMTLTIANSQDYVAWCVVIDEHEVININTDLYIAVASNATLSLADPPNLDTGAIRRYLWLTAAAIDVDSTSTVNSVPTSFTTVITQRSSAQGGSVILSIAERDLEAQAHNPTTYNHNLQEWVAFTIAIPPGFAENLPEPIDLVGITDTVTTLIAPFPIQDLDFDNNIGITDVVNFAIGGRHRQPWPQAR